MEKGLSEVSWPGTSLFARFGYLQAQVDRLVGPLFERRSVKDWRQTARDLLGRRESDRFSMPRQERAS
jgi:hypothetical protein